jgi:hypothetical protein
MNSSQYKLEWPKRPVFLPVWDGALGISFCLLKWGVPASTGMELITMGPSPKMYKTYPFRARIERAFLFDVEFLLQFNVEQI